MHFPRGYGYESPGRISAGSAQLCGLPGAAVDALTGFISSSGISAIDEYTAPASSSRTRLSVSALSRPASAPPADPDPTTMTSNSSTAFSTGFPPLQEAGVCHRATGLDTRRLRRGGSEFGDE